VRYQIGQANRLGNRPRNEDRFAAYEDNGTLLLVLADGMGGHTGGEFAAQALIEIAGDAFNNIAHPVADVPAFFTMVVERTHHTIHEFAVKHQLGTPPGTTGVLCLVQNGTAQWAHVGDSRLYLFRNHVPLYRTRDHSYVEKLFSRGEIRRSDKSGHPMRNQITQCIGCLAQLPQLDISKPTSLFESDVILLCSDGLWGALEDMRMATQLEESDIDEAVNKLAETAERESYPQSDNISVLAVRILSTGRDGKAEREEDFELNVPNMLRPRRPQPEKLQDAIEQIEQAIKQYEKEMKR
jgi:serine/threonine protein phosphatase PrpC